MIRKKLFRYKSFNIANLIVYLHWKVVHVGIKRIVERKKTNHKMMRMHGAWEKGIKWCVKKIRFLIDLNIKEGTKL